MATSLKHFKSDGPPTATKMVGRLSFAPTVQAIIVDRESMATVNPQLTSIVRVDAEAVMASPEDSHAPCPTHSEIVTSAETWPIATCVAIVHSLGEAHWMRRDVSPDQMIATNHAAHHTDTFYLFVK